MQEMGKSSLSLCPEIEGDLFCPAALFCVADGPPVRVQLDNVTVVMYRNHRGTRIWAAQEEVGSPLFLGRTSCPCTVRSPNSRDGKLADGFS